jgi:RNA-directed DNA polymerase
MLTRLEASEPTTVWYGLWDKVISERNLQAAFWAVWRNGEPPEWMAKALGSLKRRNRPSWPNCAKNCGANATTDNRPDESWIPKPGTTEKRPLGIPAVRDRTVEAALKHVLEPIFERDFAEHSYGFRPGRGCREAVKRVEQLLEEGRIWCVDLDFKSYFDTIPHERLLGLIQRRVVDGSVLALLEQSLKAGVLEALKGWEPTERARRKGRSSVRCWPTCILTRWTTRWSSRDGRWCAMRTTWSCYAGPKKKRASAQDLLRDWAEEAGLTVHPTKTRIVNAQSEGFDFLGWHFCGGKKWPRKKSLQKLQEKLRPLTRRTSGRAWARSSPR